MGLRRRASKKAWIAAALAAVLLAILWLAHSGQRSSPKSQAETSRQPKPRGAEAFPTSNKAAAPVATPATAAVRRDERRHSELSDSVLLAGWVQTDEGDPIPFAEISIYALDAEEAQTISSTDSSGRYRIESKGDRTVRLTVGRDAFASLEDYLDLPAQGPLNRDYTLQRATSSIHGRIVDESDQPVPRARVRLGFPLAPRPDAAPRYLDRTATTDAEGFFQFDNLPRVEITLTISARGFFEEIRHVQLQKGREGRRRFRLRRGRLRWLTVTDAAGEPIESARLDCGPLANYRSDAEGRIEFVLPDTSSSINCEVTAPGRLSKWALIDPRVQNTKVVLEEGPIFEGLVLTESGQPVAGAEVVISGRDHRFEGMLETQPDGRFSLTLAWPPSTRISVKHPAFVEQVLHLSAEQESSSIEIRLKSPEGGIFGRVLQANGAPVPRFTIFLRDGERRFARTFEDREGRFEIDNLPAGSYRAVATTGIPEFLSLKAEAGPLEVLRGRRVGEVVFRFPEP